MNEEEFTQVQAMLLEAKTEMNAEERKKMLQKVLQLCHFAGFQVELRIICLLLYDLNSLCEVVNLCRSAANNGDPENLALKFFTNGEPADDKQGFNAYTQRTECYQSIFYLFELKPRDLPEWYPPSRSLLKACIDSNDEVLHYCLFDWLMFNNQTDTFLTINSSYLEGYLNRCIETRKNIIYKQVLAHVYEKNLQFKLAARMFTELAETKGYIGLQERINYLKYALRSWQSSEHRDTENIRSELAVYRQESDKKLQLARLQEDILDYIGNKYRSAEIVAQMLNSRLLDPYELYENFACAFNLPEYKLAILQLVEYNDPLLIQNLWEDAIEQEMFENMHLETEEKIRKLKNKIMYMILRHRNSEEYLVLGNIIKILELKTCMLDCEKSGIFKIFLAANIPMLKLVNSYIELLKDYQFEEIKPSHVVTVLTHIFSFIIEYPQLVPLQSRQLFIAQSIKNVEEHIMGCTSLKASDPDMRKAVEDFYSIKQQLQIIL